jgi:MarR-like DNA-binding transcriptional regulator SgrR of sgrS sRNA
LRIAIAESPSNLDPATSDSAALRSLSGLVFENLVKLDGRGRPQPLLASSWQAEPGNQRWRFSIRNGVIFSDGTPLDANTAAASLRAGNPHWKVFALGELVMIETQSPDPNVAAELALPRNSIVRRAKGSLSGTGPFTIGQLDGNAKHLTLAANDQYWGGRPFLDTIEVDFARNDRDQLMALDLGKEDLVEVTPEAIRSAQAANRTVVASQPQELMCLVFAQDPRSDAEIDLRGLLARTIDTVALNNVVFQGGGEPTAAMLPNWLSGYAFIFAGTPTTRERATQRAGWTSAYDANDPTARIVADRINLNAKDAGIILQPGISDNAELRLTRIPLESINPAVALDELAATLQLNSPSLTSNSLDELYRAEKSLLATHRVVPLLHLRNAVAFHPNVRGISILPNGRWNLQDGWLAPETP